MLDWTDASPTPRSRPCSGALAAGSSGRVVRREALTGGERDRMWRLFDAHFAAGSRAGFERDLAEKHWVVLVEAGGQVLGFSTIQRLEVESCGEALVAFYSGDTVVHPAARAELGLASLWSRHVFGLAAAESAPVWWFLISSGYKTYRFLPVFFREFYPRWERPTPAGPRGRLDALGAHKFGQRYDPATGIVRLASPSPLRPGVADLSPARLRDPHVAFFAARNPGHAQGDELACLAELSPLNVTPAGRRALGLPRSPP